MKRSTPSWLPRSLVEKSDDSPSPLLSSSSALRGRPDSIWAATARHSNKWPPRWKSAGNAEKNRTRRHTTSASFVWHLIADCLQAANRSETSDSSCVERIPKKDARPIEIGRASDEDLCFPERKSSPGSHGADSVVARPIIVRQRQKMPRIAMRHQLSLVSARSRTVYEQPNRVDGWVRFRWMFGAGGLSIVRWPVIPQASG